MQRLRYSKTAVTRPQQLWTAWELWGENNRRCWQLLHDCKGLWLHQPSCRLGAALLQCWQLLLLPRTLQLFASLPKAPPHLPPLLPLSWPPLLLKLRFLAKPTTVSCKAAAHLVAVVPDVKVEMCEQVLACLRLAVSTWLVLCLTDEAPHGQIIVKEHLHTTQTVTNLLLHRQGPPAAAEPTAVPQKRQLPVHRSRC
jgi:hypothetical protein